MAMFTSKRDRKRIKARAEPVLEDATGRVIGSTAEYEVFRCCAGELV